MTHEEERAAALEQDSMSNEAWMGAALEQYGAVYGAEAPDRAWILTPYDTWEPNPYYRGPPARHPEEDADGHY